MNHLTPPPPIDKSWTLFLDRDGVINVEIIGSYVTSWGEFQFCDGALEALRTLSDIFGIIVVVTNQRGVGKGIMTIASLREIHQQMTASVAAAGGKLDQIYACTAVSNNDHNRKPNIGMGLQAKEDFPQIDFRKSIIVGNSLSDMEFGKRLSMHAVFLTTKHDRYPLPHDLIDEQFPSLIAWSNSLVPAAVLG